MLKQIVTLCALCAALTLFSARAGDAVDEGLNKEKCAFNGFPLYGNVQVVDSFPDVKVQIVDSFPDLKVKIVDSFPDDCGEWKWVDSFPDVKIQYVDSFPDVKIEMTASFPGWP